MYRLLFGLLLWGAAGFTHAQSYTPASARMDAYTQRNALQANSLLGEVEFTSVGPTIMSGRVVDIDANPADPSHFYVAYASGGLWKTTSNGTAFNPLFDDQAVMTIGDIAVNWANGETIWMGTGESNSSRSSYAGAGLYRSADGGKTWTHLGLEETHHIGRVVLHPSDPNTVWVAAVGHLYSANPERGIFKTRDGGQTWQKALFVDDNTGAVDLVLDPSNPDVLYAAMWHRTRRAWDFVESGTTSGLYKSTDGGDTWALLSTEDSGFPTGAGVGRIGLDIHPAQTNTLYAIVDNQNRRDKDPDEEEPALTKEMLRTISAADLLAQVEETDLADYLERNNFPEKYKADAIIEQIRDGSLAPIALVEYVEDANSQLFDTPVIGAEVYRTDDGGQTWARTHEDYIDAMYNSYGYYFGHMRVAPSDVNRIYLTGVPLLRSDDGGKTFINIDQDNVHSDHHAVWINPARPGHLINGNDGGANLSYDDGETWFKLNTPAVGQFYAIAIDMAEPYNIYGGLQDNGVWTGPSTYEAGDGWHQEGNYPYDRIYGGDGMQTAVDFRDNNTVYTGLQFGFYARIDKATGKRTSVRPQHELGERPLRFNWQTPIHLSRHNEDILYMGAQKLFRSMNQGEDFEAISEDLTRGGQAGDVPYGTLTSIDESPFKFGVIYVGSDDGYVHLTRDGGVAWTRISDTLPEAYANYWVSRVEASKHDEATVYVSLNGYRMDQFEALVFRSTDYGQTWAQLGSDLPTEPVNVVLEDPENTNLLYVGTDHGLYASLDGGQTFMGMINNMPYTPVHDLRVHPREHDLIVGTHGRSIYIADVTHVQQLTDELLAEAVHFFPIDEVRHSDRWGNKSWAWGEPVEPEVQVAYYLKAAGPVTVRVKTEGGDLLHEWTEDGSQGLNYTTYDLAVDAEAWATHQKALADENDEDPPKAEETDTGKTYPGPGTYTVEVEAAGTTQTQMLTIPNP